MHARPDLVITHNFANGLTAEVHVCGWLCEHNLLPCYGCFSLQRLVFGSCKRGSSSASKTVQHLKSDLSQQSLLSTQCTGVCLTVCIGAKISQLGPGLTLCRVPLYLEPGLPKPTISQGDSTTPAASPEGCACLERVPAPILDACVTRL